MSGNLGFCFNCRPKGFVADSNKRKSRYSGPQCPVTVPGSSSSSASKARYEDIFGASSDSDNDQESEFDIEATDGSDGDSGSEIRPRARARIAIDETETENDNDNDNDNDNENGNGNGNGSGSGNGNDNDQATATATAANVVNGRRAAPQRDITGATATNTNINGNAGTPPRPIRPAQLPGGGYGLHDQNGSVHAVHIVLDKVRGDVEEVHLQQLLQYCLHHNVPWFWGSREKGKLDGGLHDHLVCLMFIDKSKRGLAELRSSIYSWLHNGDPDPATRVHVRHSTGYKLWTAFLKPGQDLIAVLGYEQKDAGLQHNKQDGGSWPEGMLHHSWFKNGKVLPLCERTLFYGRRAHSMFAQKRTGTPVDRTGINGALFRIANGPSLKYLAPFMTLCEKLRLMLIADNLLKIRPHDNLAIDAAHRCNPRSIMVMDLWSRTDDSDLHSVVTVDDVNHVFFRGTAPSSKPRPPTTTAGYHMLNTDEVDYAAVTYSQAADLNTQVASSVQDTLAASRASRFSTTLLTHDALRERIAAGTYAVDGQNSIFNTTTAAGPGPVADAAVATVPQPTRPVLLDFSADFVTRAAPFLAQFKLPAVNTLTRFMFLIIVGETRTGKSLFAEHALGFKSPYTNEGGFHLGGFSHEVNDAIILSDVPNIAEHMLKYKAVFQSNDKTTVVGESNTNMYAITVNTHRTPIVVTMNKEADWDKVKDEAWITGNSYVIDCGSSPMYDGAAGVATEDETNRAAAWSKASQ
jgi:hypothetical protein